MTTLMGWRSYRIKPSRSTYGRRMLAASAAIYLLVAAAPTLKRGYFSTLPLQHPDLSGYVARTIRAVQPTPSAAACNLLWSRRQNCWQFLRYPVTEAR